MKELSVDYIEITNKDILVTYTPSLDVINYSYTIEKDGVKQSPIFINLNTPTDITLKETGTYKIEITSLNNLGIKKVITGNYKIDKEPPVLNIKNKTLKIKANEKINILDNVVASDINDGDLTSGIKTNAYELDLSIPGIKTIEYSVTDAAGNTTSSSAYLTVLKNNDNLILLGQIGIGILLLSLILFLIKYIKSIKLEKRFSKYTINSSKNKSISLLDSIHNHYLKFIDKLSKILSKSSIINNMSKKYEKYDCMFEKYNSINFISRKIVLGFIYIIIAIIVSLISSKILTILEMILPFILGFYTLDIIYILKFSKYKKKIENDMLNAITLMNNAFKAGKSIVQAVEIVSRELTGPISKEFKRIEQEIMYGIDIDIAFKRFKDRIKIKEAAYLSSSLSVLNKTGGNIIKVFDTIEKNVINRKKLQNELKTLTSSSKLITYVLIFVPIVFIIFIGIVNIGYFEPLFKNPLGIVIILVSLIIYIAYIIIVKRIMKVKV